MSLSLAAQHLASQGRGNDTHLVHMTTGELQALQKLAESRGGSLTVNPKTGLPEAGFLSAILPMAAGLAGAAFGIPTELLAPAIGLADYAMTGSLMNGVMAGFGAWSGSKFGTDLSNFGEAPIENPPTPSELNPPTAPNVPTTSIPQVPTVSPDTVLPNIPEMPANPADAFMPPSQTIPQVPADQLNPLSQSAVPMQPSLSQGLQNALQHPINFLSQPGVGMHALSALGPVALQALKGVMTPSSTSGAPVASNLSNVPAGNQLKYNSPNFQANIPAQPSPAYAAQYANYIVNPYNPYVAASSGGGLQHVHKMAGGDLAKELEGYQEMQEGIAGLRRKPVDLPTSGPGIYRDTEAGMDTATPLERSAALWKMATSHLPKKQVALMAQTPQGLGAIPTQTAMEAADAQAAQSIAQSPTPTSAKEGGLMNGHLGGYSDGGRLLKGPGDGVSDSIPATIGQKQPARLAEGEFVIPARIVSELGNGSTDAGAKRLYAMMDRIKAKRAKAKDIAADTKAYKELPV